MSNKVFRDHLHKIVDTAVQMDVLFHDWLANFDPEAALLFAQKSEVYNRMTRTGLVGLVKAINKIAPAQDFGEGNPNTGRKCHEYQIGNEGSRVIYVIFKTSYVRDVDWESVFEKVCLAAKQAHSDEFSVTKDEFKGWVIRIWWD